MFIPYGVRIFEHIKSGLGTILKSLKSNFESVCIKFVRHFIADQNFKRFKSFKMPRKFVFFVFNWLAPIVMPYIDPFQFGSVKKSSTTHALVHLVHYWLSALEVPNTIIRTCFIDFSKAFDLIDHNILMHKLQILNVPPVLLNWCSRFLQNRQQRVTLRTCKSNWKEIKAGVPQGTKLGPLFFLIMVKNLHV